MSSFLASENPILPGCAPSTEQGYLWCSTTPTTKSATCGEVMSAVQPDMRLHTEIPRGSKVMSAVQPDMRLQAEIPRGRKVMSAVQPDMRLQAEIPRGRKVMSAVQPDMRFQAEIPRGSRRTGDHTMGWLGLGLCWFCMCWYSQYCMC